MRIVKDNKGGKTGRIVLLVLRFNLAIKFFRCRSLWRGLADNWREYRFYSKTHHPFCQPTHFSFFGLVNFQALGDVCQMHEESFYLKMSEFLGEDDWAKTRRLGLIFTISAIPKISVLILMASCAFWIMVAF